MANLKPGGQLDLFTGNPKMRSSAPLFGDYYEIGSQGSTQDVIEPGHDQRRPGSKLGPLRTTQGRYGPADPGVVDAVTVGRDPDDYDSNNGDVMERPPTSNRGIVDSTAGQITRETQEDIYIEGPGSNQWLGHQASHHGEQAKVTSEVWTQYSDTTSRAYADGGIGVRTYRDVTSSEKTKINPAGVQPPTSEG